MGFDEDFCEYKDFIEQLIEDSNVRHEFETGAPFKYGDKILYKPPRSTIEQEYEVRHCYPVVGDDGPSWRLFAVSTSKSEIWTDGPADGYIRKRMVN